jgi:hypothetical protein
VRPNRLGSLLIALALAGPAAGQTIPAGGSEVFRFALHQKKLEPATGFEEIRSNPRGSIIIALGNADALNSIVRSQELRSFVLNGGAVLIASDQSNRHEGFPFLTWNLEFRLTLRGDALEAPEHRCYRGVTTRPMVLATPFLNGDDRRLFLGLEKPVATDRPTGLILNDGQVRLPQAAPPPGLDLTELAIYPPGTRSIRTGQPLDPAANHFAVALRPKPLGRQPGNGGRMLVLADHSVFANGMLGFVKDETRPEGYTLDNGNWEFANRTIDWLQGGSPEPRTKCLFIENGNIVPKFAVELPPGSQPPKMPNIPPELILNWLLTNADPILNEYQDKGVFDKFLRNRPSLLRNVIRFVVIGLTVMFVLMALRRLIRGYRKPDARPLPTAVSEGMLPRGGVARQRTDAQLEVGNLYEAARRRVRDRFDRLGGAPAGGGEMPPVLVANDIRDGELLRSAVAWLWPIGYGDVPVPVPPTEWDRVNALLERLTRRAAAGDWSFGAVV